MTMSIKHGQAKSGSKRPTPEYHAWLAMKSRCNNPNTASYENYGGRGVAVCSRWEIFENFFEDMGLRPGKGYSLDRYPDYSGNYEPGNCRWANSGQQANNKRTTRWVDLDGERLSLTEAAKRLGLERSVIFGRLRRGWSFEEAINTPRHPRGSRHPGMHRERSDAAEHSVLRAIGGRVA